MNESGNSTTGGVWTTRLGRWGTVTLVGLLLVSLVVWFVKRERVPRRLRFATAKEGGFYHKLGTFLAANLEKRLGRTVTVQPTAGSEKNVELLEMRDADLAIVQDGTPHPPRLRIAAPLYPELVHVIVRKGSPIRSVSDLQGHAVSLGEHGSGNRDVALTVLTESGVADSSLTKTEAYFLALKDDADLDAAIVVAGVNHPDLRKLLATKDFELLPLSNARALSLLYSHLQVSQIPVGLYGARPSLPERPLDTVATTAFLAVDEKAPDALVEAVLASVHDDRLHSTFPSIMSRAEAKKWGTSRLHSYSQRYYFPSDSIGFLANVMESLAAIKELLFAIGAGMYLLWLRWRRLKERESLNQLSYQKERLDVFLEKTLRIESQQMHATDGDVLRRLLDETTKIKLEALHEFTEEELRGDQVFAIFLAQCANLISKIQLKIMSMEDSGSA